MRIQETQRAGLLARNSFLNLVGQVLPLFVAVATIPYILEGLGTNGFGILSLAWMLLGYFGMFDFGLSRATTKVVAEHLHSGLIHKLPGLIWTSVGIQLLLGVAGAIIAMLFVPFGVNRLFQVPTAWMQEATTSLFILCAAVPALLASNALRGVLEAAQRFDLVNYVKVPASVSLYVVAACATQFGITVSGIVLLLVLSRCMAAVAYLIFCLRVFPRLKGHVSLSSEAVRPLVSFGGWVMVSNTAGPVFVYVERFIIATILPLSSLTFYSAPFELISKVLIFPASIATALFPVFSYHGNTNSAVVSDITYTTVKYLLFVMTPITAVFVVFSKDILELWLGPEFALESSVVLQLLAISFFLNAFALIPYTSVQALGRPDLKAIWDVVTLPTYAISAWLLIERLGLNGAALAKLTFTALDFLALFAFAWKLKAFSLRGFWSGPLHFTLLASAGLALTFFLIELAHTVLSVKLGLVSVCVALYLISFWMLAVDGNERSTFRKMLRRQGSPQPHCE